MKRKYIIGLCLLVCILTLSACTKKVEEKHYRKERLEQVAETLIEYSAEGATQKKEELQQIDELEVKLSLMQASLPVEPKVLLEMLEVWEQGEKENGEYFSHGEFQIEEKKEGIRLSTLGEFQERPGEIVFLFDEKLQLSGVSIDGKFSTGEIIKKAGMNILLGMGTVFFVLILISCLISLFRFIPILEKRLQRSKHLVLEEETQKEPMKCTTEKKEEVTEDVVAAIVAAIAATEHLASDQVLIRSIRLRKH